MSAFHLTATVLFADLSPAPRLPVVVEELNLGPNSNHNLGQTDDSGRISADIRNHRQISVPDNPWNPFGGYHDVDDPADRPTFLIKISDSQGHSFTSPPFFYDVIGNVRIVLPPNFPLDSPSDIANRRLHTQVDPNAPGREFMVRNDGAVWVEAAHGHARLPAMAMTDDVIIHIASMSKPICATALVAMIEDWSAIQAAVSALATGQPQPSQPLTFLLQETGLPPVHLATFQVPDVLAPLFANKAAARDFVNQGFVNAIPAGPLRLQITGFATVDELEVTPIPPVPPGHLGLLRRVMQGVPPPSYSDPFLPLLQDRLQATATSVGAAYQVGSGIAAITLEQLLTHTSPLIDGLKDPALMQQPGWAAAQPVEPTDGSRATFRLWPYLLLLLRQDATGPQVYKNDNYTTLGGIIECCTETAYDDFVVRRLFSDARFNKIRRHVVDPKSSAWYYQGQAPFWSIGNPLPDYTGWSAAGGWYVSARQITDWMHTLFIGQPVARIIGQAPLLSASSVAQLFGSPPYFSGGKVDTLANGVMSFRHNGGTAVGSGSINGKLSVLVGPGKSVHTAFFAANGNLSADVPFDATLNDLINSNDWS